LGTLREELGDYDLARTHLEKAVGVCERLAAGAPPEFAVRKSLARDLVKLANLDRKQGAKAEQILAKEKRAFELRQQLVREQPLNPELQHELAQSHNNLGLCGEDRLQHLEKAMAIWEKLVADHPANIQYGDHLALAYHNLAYNYEWQKRDESIRFHTKALTLRADLAGKQPASPKAHIHWAESHHHLANSLENLLGQIAEARRHREESVRVVRQFAGRHPQWPSVKSKVASLGDMLGTTLLALNDVEAATKEYEASARVWAELADAYPDDVAYQIGLAGTNNNLASLLSSGPQANRARDLLNDAEAHLTEVLKRTGGSEQARGFLRNVHLTSARLGGRLASWDEAFRHWDSAIDLTPSAEQVELRLERARARVFAGQSDRGAAEALELSGIIRGKDPLIVGCAAVLALAAAASQDSARQDTYASQSVEVLRAAYGRGDLLAEDAAAIRAGDAFKAIHDREDFAALLAEIDSKSPTQGER
jgi:tetratricopeptide (TPR) repeat protein